MSKNSIGVMNIKLQMEGNKIHTCTHETTWILKKHHCYKISTDKKGTQTTKDIYIYIYYNNIY